MISALALLGLVLLSPPATDTPEWGAFRGNNGCGVSGTASIPDELDPAAARWRVEIPPGYSSPVVAGERIFLTGESPADKKLITLCLDRASGEELWRDEVEFDGKRVGANSSAAPSPACDGEVVAVLFHATGVTAYRVDGEKLWHSDLGEINIPHGMSTSPLIHDGKVIVLVDQDGGSFLTVFDRDSGEVQWRVDREGYTHSYATPAIYTSPEGKTQIIASGSGEIGAYSLDDGELLWHMRGAAWQTKSVPLIAGNACIVNAYMVPSSEFGIPRINETWEEALDNRDANEDGKIARSEWQGIPMLQQAWFIFDLDGDDMLDERDFNYLLSAGTQSGGLYSIGLDGEGDVTDTHVRWQFDGKRGLPDIPSPVLHDGILYMVKEGGVFTSVDVETGEVIKQGRVGSSDGYFASPVVSGDRIITVSHSGLVSVIHAGRDWEEVSTSNLDEETWATPAIAGNQVFVRTQKALYCFDGAAQG